MQPFIVKSSLLKSWFNAKGFSGSAYDSANGYFKSKSGLSSGLLLDHIIKTVSGLGGSGNVDDQLTYFFRLKTGKSLRQDAERAFFNDASLDFTIITVTKFVILDPTDGYVGDSIAVTVQAQDVNSQVVASYSGSVTLNASGSATGGGIVTITNGTGSKNITDATAETITLSLTDSAGTGFNCTSTQNLSFAQGGIDSFTKLMLHMDGTNGSTTFTDSEIAPTKTMTAVGLSQISTAQSVFGGASGLFNGATDFLTTPDSADFDVSNGDFTVDCRVRFASVGAKQVFFNQGDDGVAATNSFFWRFNDDGHMEMYYTATGSADQAVGVIKAWSPSINIWYHIACVRSSANMYFFVDGTQIGTTHNIGTTTIFNSTTIANVGCRVNATLNIQTMNGYIDEFRFSKGVARWTSNFTLPTAAYST